MHEKLIGLCAAVGAVGAMAAEILGGWDNSVITLIIFMGTDFVMGLLCAIAFGKSDKSENGALSSKACWRGLCKKCCTLLIVMVAHYADILIGTDYIRNAVIIAFCAAELISICEIAGLMGIMPEPVQHVLTTVIDILKNKDIKDIGKKEDDNDENE